MFASKDDEQPTDGQQFRKSLQNLGKSIQSLLGSKEDLTFRWAESVRFIIEELSTECGASPDSPSSPVHEQISDEERQKLEEDIAKLNDELQKLRGLLKDEDAKRSDLLNEYLDLKGNVRVFCRVRPLLDKERRLRAAPVVSPALDRVLVTSSTGKRKSFQLDKIFLPASGQEDVFAEVGPLVKSALDGHNVCIFAYGQTGTGKTFTMEGTKDAPGVVPRTLELLFQQAAMDSGVNFHFTFSMLELYMGCLRDLLVPAHKRITDPRPKCLSIQMDVKGRVEVENLAEFVVSDAHQASQLYRIGSRARSNACTNSNEASSRSHCLIRVTMSSSGGIDKSPVVSKLWLVDLGGSERLRKTEAKGRNLEEGKAINLSLSALGDVISALQKRQAHIPYRNSKLTQILRDSLGEDAKTVMIVHVSPKEDDVGETICSLGFASRARGIHLGQELSPGAKEERARAMEGVMGQLQERENSCQYLRDNIQELEFLSRKKKKMLEIGKNESEHPRDELPMQSTSVERSSEKKGRRTDGLQSIPRFMTATTCSRLKERSEPNYETPLCARKGEKFIQAEKKYPVRTKSKAAKISPMDSSLVSEQLTDQRQSDACETKVIDDVTKSKGMDACTTLTARKLINVLEEEWNQQGSCHASSKQQEHKHPTSQRRASHECCRNPSMAENRRRRLTLECSGQIMIKTRV